MLLDKDVGILQRLPLFAGMDHEHISMIAFSSERLLFQHGEKLAINGQLGQAAYVILSGSAEIVEGDGGNRHIRLVGPGTILAELAMLVELTHTSTVIATEEVEVLELPRALIHMMMQDFPPIADHFSGRIHGRLSKMAENLRRYNHPASPPPLSPSEMQGAAR